jgi:hypothetical protein
VHNIFEVNSLDLLLVFFEFSQIRNIPIYSSSTPDSWKIATCTADLTNKQTIISTTNYIQFPVLIMSL